MHMFDCNPRMQSTHQQRQLGVAIGLTTQKQQGADAIARQSIQSVSAAKFWHHVLQDINAVEEGKKNLAARGTPLPEDYCKVVQMRAART